MEYVTLFLIVLGVNLPPAFGPPTWAILVFTRITWHLNPVAIVLLGVVAAMAGRFLLASGTRRFRGRLGESRRANLRAASDLLFERRGRAWAVLGIFVVSPLPSAQLFVAAGLLEIELLPLTLAFGLGRLVSYSFYVALATLADKQLGSVLGNALGSPWSVALQVVLLAGAAALPFVNWSKLLESRRRTHGDEPATGDPAPPPG